MQSVADTMARSYPALVVGNGNKSGITASILDAGEGLRMSYDTMPLHSTQVRLVDAVTGHYKIVLPAAGVDVSTKVAPGDRWIAFEYEAGIQSLPKGTVFGTINNMIEVREYSITVTTRNGDAMRFATQLPQETKPGTIRWSKDGEEFTYVSAGTRPADPPQLVRVNPAEGTVQRLPLSIVGPDSARWIYRYQLNYVESGSKMDGILVGAKTKGLRGRSREGETDWFLIPLSGSPRRVTEAERRALVVQSEVNGPDSTDVIEVKKILYNIPRDGYQPVTWRYTFWMKTHEGGMPSGKPSLQNKAREMLLSHSGGLYLVAVWLVE